jgi:hypothetical protein
MIFADEEGVPRGHPQALTLVPLGYFLGWHGHPQVWAFVHTSSHLISSLSIPYTWKLPSYKTSHNSISNVSINMIVNQPIWFSFKLKYTTYKAYNTVATFSKVPWSKELKKKAIERQTQIVAKICQNRTTDKGRFFRGPSVAQIEK